MRAPLAGRRIGLLTASASRQGGGVFEAVVAQARLVRELGAEPVVFALADADSATDATRFDGAEVILCDVLGPRIIGFAPALADFLDRGRLDLLHLHGIWMYPSRAGSSWARRSGKPYVISPHGMLDPWIVSRGRWKKALARTGYERQSWRAAACFHALTEAEAADVGRETGRSDSLVIPNPAPTCEAGVRRGGHDIIYIGRIHSKKNLLALVSAWHRARRPDGPRLRIAGWGDGADVAALQAAIAAGDASVEFLGPVFGEAKEHLLERARFVVLPSHSEGLPMAMLEAWAAGKPTLMTQHCNLPQGFAAGAALDCGTSTEQLSAAIERALSMSAGEWDSMSEAALALTAGPSSAAAIADLWASAYSRLIVGATGFHAAA